MLQKYGSVDEVLEAMKKFIYKKNLIKVYGSFKVESPEKEKIEEQNQELNLDLESFEFESLNPWNMQ